MFLSHRHHEAGLQKGSIHVTLWKYDLISFDYVNNYSVPLLLSILVIKIKLKTFKLFFKTIWKWQISVVDFCMKLYSMAGTVG